ncbi:unnamed protein product [Porites evermanni]|uniref:Uncharacterized protein n=1 Tax=Porites evermanni TaxID=104178 RepID=A0ABN8S5C3_9CNID|nr:unnamed protein product [Porites evermanni]
MDLPEEYMEPILDAIMPIREVKLIHKTAIESRQQHMEDFPSASMNTMHLLFSGSSEEGLYLPDLSLVRKPLHSSESSMVSADKDIMIVWENWPVNEKLRRKAFAVLEVKGSHPGYCRLRFNPAFSSLSPRTERQPELRSIEHGGLDKNGFIYNSKFVATMSKKLKLQKQGISVFEVIDRPGYNLRTNHLLHGPAFTSSVACSGGNDLSVDYVHSLHCREWPEVASEWIHRHRPSGWPSPRLIRDIAKQGCHVVPVSHRRSQRPSVEWRLSFSEAEVTLALTLSSVPRRCYIFLKLLHIYKFKRHGVALVTYFLKTALFWICESISLSEWKEMKTVEGIKRLLQFLLNSCEERALPNYFAPQNNLFSGLGLVQMSKTKEAIREVLANPVQNLVDLTQFYNASHMPVEPLISEIVGCCLSRFPRPVSSSELSKFQSCLRGHVVNGLLTQGDSTYEALAVVTSCEDIEKLPSATDCLAAFERFVAVESDLGGIDLKLQLAVIASIYHNLGCLALLENDQEAHSGFCQKAKNLFETLLIPSDPIDIHQIWMFVDYCNLLRSLKEYDKALRVVYAVMKEQSNKRYPNVCNTYANHNSHTGGDYFSWEVEHLGSVDVLSFGNLMYVAAMCHVDRGRELRGNRHTGHKGAWIFAGWLEEFVRDKCNRFPAIGDEANIAMLGFLMMEMEEHQKAIEMFNWALEVNPSSLHAEVYRDLAADEINKNLKNKKA